MPPEDLITELSLDDESNVRKVTSNVVRAVAGAAGGGLLVTAAGIMVVDALLRRRARRWAGVAVGGARARHAAEPGTPGVVHRSALAARRPIRRRRLS